MVVEEVAGPFEAVGFGPVPVVDVGAVGSVFHDPSLVAFDELCHVRGFEIAYYKRGLIELSSTESEAERSNSIRCGSLLTYMMK